MTLADLARVGAFGRRHVATLLGRPAARRALELEADGAGPAADLARVVLRATAPPSFSRVHPARLSLRRVAVRRARQRTTRTTRRHTHGPPARAEAAPPSPPQKHDGRSRSASDYGRNGGALPCAPLLSGV